MRHVLVWCLFSVLLAGAMSVLFLLRERWIPRLSLQADKSEILCREKVRFTLRMERTGFYPFSRIEATYGLYRKGEEKQVELMDTYHLFQRKGSFFFDVNLDFCGVYQVEITEIRFFDTLGIFSRKAKLLPSTQVVVMPEEISVVSDVEKLALEDVEANESDPNAGTDVSEIKELREYREGDLLSRVHWKLSTKSEDLIVKEYAKLAGVCISVICDGSYENPEDMTKYYELLQGLGRQFLKEEFFFELVYWDKEEEQTVQKRIDNSYDLGLAIQKMYYSIKSVTLEEILLDLASKYSRNQNYLITTRLEDNAEVACEHGKVYCLKAGAQFF